MDVPLIHQISPSSLPVMSHMDWDLSNIVLHPNLDGVAGVIDWERAGFPQRVEGVFIVCAISGVDGRLCLMVFSSTRN